MKFQNLKRISFILVFFYSMSLCRTWSVLHAETYQSGAITVKHTELAVKRNGRGVKFNHPCKLSGNVIANALSYIYYEEKGLLKKKGSLRVFQDDEINGMTPLIVQAFSAAKPTQVITVSSYSERMLLTDQQNYCILFVSDNALNVAFSRIHMFQTYNDTMSEKKRFTSANENPAKISHSRFWKLQTMAGQRMEPGHENWLVIDLSNETYQTPVAQRVGTVDEKIKLGASELDIRLRKLEEKMKSSGETGQSRLTSPSKESRSESKIKAKLTVLRELVNDGIISEEDYDYKKAKMLREAMADMSIKEQLREIKDLKTEELITEDDYNEKKKDLLDQF